MIGLINFPIILSVNAPICTQRSIIWSPLKIISQLFELLKNFELLLNHINKGSLHLSWKTLMPRYPEKLSVASFHSQIKVFAWQHDLQKILVVQKTISIGIIEVDQSLAVILCE